MTLSRKPWHTNHKNGGFSLIEILLVIVIIGVMMAVIIPRATRARVDAKYNVVRQMAAEVGKWSLTWANRNLETQRDDHTCDLRSYIETLTGDFTGDQAATSNWAGSIETLIGGGECRNPDTTAPIVTTVADIVPDVSITNPFNGISYFMAVNNGDSGSGGSHGPGKLYLASFQETSRRGHLHQLLLSLSGNRWHGLERLVRQPERRVSGRSQKRCVSGQAAAMI